MVSRTTQKISDMLRVEKQVKFDIYLKRLLSLMVFIMWVSYSFVDKCTVRNCTFDFANFIIKV